jgi:hypothetical protein
MPRSQQTEPTHEHRAAVRHRRLFGIVTIENVVQVAVLLVAIAMFTGGIRSDTDANTRDIREIKTERATDHDLLMRIDEKVSAIKERVDKQQ